MNPEHSEQYREHGFVVPVPVMSTPEALATRQELERFEATQGGHLNPALGSRAYLLFKWLDQRIHDPRVLDLKALAFHEKADLAMRNVLYAGAQQNRAHLSTSADVLPKTQAGQPAPARGLNRDKSAGACDQAESMIESSPHCIHQGDIHGPVFLCEMWHVCADDLRQVQRALGG